MKENIKDNEYNKKYSKIYNHLSVCTYYEGVVYLNVNCVFESGHDSRW